MSKNLPSVCLVAELPPPTGGMAVQAQRLGDGLRGEGHVVWNVRSNALSYSSPLRRVKYLRGVVNLALFIAELVWLLPRADVVHIFSTSNLSFFLFTVPPALLGRLLGRRVIIHYHGGGAEEFFRAWPRAVLPVLRGADSLIVPSGFLVNAFARFGLAAVPIVNTLDLGRFRFEMHEPLQPRVLIARHLRFPYNVACGIRAFARLHVQFPNATLTVAGDGREREELERLCSELGLSRCVRFVGNVDNARMHDLFHEAHIYLNSSQIDNQPVSILEAFACGLPVVSTAVGGIPYMVRQGEDGLLADDNDDTTLAEHMVRLLSDAALARRLVLSGRERIAEYTWVKVYPQLREQLGSGSVSEGS